jgi:RimJ/RimL family protein N-acetyltransferase
MPGLVDYTLVFLDKSWEWLNDPEIKALTMTDDFTRNDQLAFFKNLPEKKDYWIKGITENELPIGAMGLKHINSQTAEYWGYIGEKEYWGKGIGKFMLDHALKKTKELKLKKLFLKVSNNNTRARNLYLKMGFKIISPGDIELYALEL